MIFAPLDALGALIQRGFTPLWQMRVGSVLLLVALFLHAAGPGLAAIIFPDEPPGIYQLSVFALTLTALTLVFQARQAAVIEDTGDDVDTHREVTEP